MTVALPAQAASATAVFTKVSDWGTGFEGKYTITNGGTTTINGWSAGRRWPGRVRRCRGWGCARRTPTRWRRTTPRVRARRAIRPLPPPPAAP
ncbi:cellulose binding domain-containing protein, partial [Streptosporangium amethystogenes]|uniref:cellulose binding domain-containing protein n=1 Tax=Streptosporangium amethystogenes TaxID=2002 RepID=UPI0012F90989